MPPERERSNSKQTAEGGKERGSTWNKETGLLGAMLRFIRIAKWPWTQILLALILLVGFRCISFLQDIHADLVEANGNLVDVQNRESEELTDVRDSVDSVKEAVEATQ